MANKLSPPLSITYIYIFYGCILLPLLMFGDKAVGVKMLYEPLVCRCSSEDEDGPPAAGRYSISAAAALRADVSVMVTKRFVSGAVDDVNAGHRQPSIVNSHTRNVDIISTFLVYFVAQQRQQLTREVGRCANMQHDKNTENRVFWTHNAQKYSSYGKQII